MSREALGKAIGISRVHIYKVEEGRADASPNLMARWAKALNASPGDIWPARDIERVRRHVEEGQNLLAKAGRAA